MVIPQLPRIGLLLAVDNHTVVDRIVSGAVERGHDVHVLSPLPLPEVAAKTTSHMKGSPLSHSAVEKFLYTKDKDNNETLNIDVVMGLYVPGRMESVATALIKALQHKASVPRIVWVTENQTDNNNKIHESDLRSLAATEDDSQGSDEQSTDDVMVLPPSPEQTSPCFELASRPSAFFGLQLDCLFPFFATKDPMEDMGESELLLQEASASSSIPLVIVRPARILSPTTIAVEKGHQKEQRYYQFVREHEPIPSNAALDPIPPRAIATALLDLAFDTNWDGTVVEVYKRDRKVAPIVSEQLDL